ncbi:MAG TPA: glutathione S-transferase family protein [Polyangia bacterium]|jgi:glutathione S-transferase|nr:glutathione S-transferase family protein [Polyangia bacterium]
MILIGQYDSPFVRRVAITLRLYDLPYQHRPWSVWGDADRIARHNPLRRVPTLLLEDGTVLVETFAIIDALDELVPPVRALLPRSGPVRRDGLRIAALSAGVADKAASLLYEPMFREAPSSAWMQRCQLQIADTLAMLQADLAGRGTPYWLGSTLSHADVAFACALRFTAEAHPTLFDPGRYRALAEHSRRCEERAEFRAVYQPITNNI